YLFEHRFLLKEDDLACGILKCFFGDVQPLVDQQEEMRTVRSTDLFYLPSQVLGMPETNKLDHDTSVLIFGIDQHEIWHHDGIPEQEHFALTRQMPVPRLLPIFCSNSLAKSASRRLSNSPERLKCE